MPNDIVNIYSDSLFNVYNKSNVPSKKGSENGWTYFQTETLLKVFQEAAEPHIGPATQPAAPASSPAPSPAPLSHPSRLQSLWPIFVGAIIVICCVLALAWQAHRQALAGDRARNPDRDLAKMWGDAAQQLMQSQLAEARVLNSNQADLASSQAQIGAGLVRLSDIDTQLAASASNQACTIRDLSAAQSAMVQATTNLEASLRQTFQQGLADATHQSHTDIEKLQTQVSAESSNLGTSLRQSSQQGLAEAARQSHTDIEKLQTQVSAESTNLGTSLRRSFDRGLAEAAHQSHADIEKLQTQVSAESTNLGTSLRRSFDRGLAEAARQGHTDIEKLQTQVSAESSNLGTSLRQSFQQGLAEATRQSHTDMEKLQTQVSAESTNLGTSLRHSFQQGLAEAARQSHTDMEKLQTQVSAESTNLGSSLRQSLKQGLAEAARQNHADSGKLQRQVAEDTTQLGTSLRQSFQQGLAEAARQNRAGIGELQAHVVRENNTLETSLRQAFQHGLAKASRQSRADTADLQTQMTEQSTNLVASLNQTVQQGLTEAARQRRADTAKLQAQVAEVTANQKALLDRLSKLIAVPRLDLDLPGVRTKSFANCSLLTFDEGLFLHGTFFKSDAKSRLQAVAKALAQASSPVRVEVIGCGDHDLAFQIGGVDNNLAAKWTERFEESLALDRASAVVDYFKGLGLFAPNRVTAYSSRDMQLPFPGDTAENRAKNRTVVLRVSMEEKPMASYVEAAPQAIASGLSDGAKATRMNQGIPR